MKGLIEKERWNVMKSAKGVLMTALLVLPMVIVAARPVRGQANSDKDLNLREYAELLRADLKAKRVEIITEIMQFDADENAAFWPVFKKYDAELSKIGDRRLDLIQDYVKSYDNMTNEKADALMSQVFVLEGQRAELKKKYFEILKKAISSVQAARFFQIENQIQHIIDLQISASLPTMQASK
jgi:hypothetical protein